MNVVYDLPFGEGHRFGGGNGVVSRLTGGWQVGVASIIRSGQLVDLGNLRLVGMSERDVSKMFKLRFDDAGRHVYLFPQDVIDNTIAAFNTSPTSPTGYAGTPPTGRYFAPANGPTASKSTPRRATAIARDEAWWSPGRCSSRPISASPSARRSPDAPTSSLASTC
jgi:hypothetical protein